MIAERKGQLPGVEANAYTNPLNQLVAILYSAAELNHDARQFASYTLSNLGIHKTLMSREFIKVRRWNNIPDSLPLREADFLYMYRNADPAEKPDLQYFPDINNMIHIPVISEIPENLRMSYPVDNNIPSQLYIEKVLQKLSAIDRVKRLIH